MEIWIPVISAIASGLCAYFAAVTKSKSELNALRLLHETELDKIKETHKLELEKLSIEVNNQKQLYEHKKQTDMVGNFMNDFMRSPEMQQKMMEIVLKEIGKR